MPCPADSLSVAEVALKEGEVATTRARTAAFDHQRQHYAAVISRSQWQAIEGTSPQCITEVAQPYGLTPGVTGAVSHTESAEPFSQSNAGWR
jgi:hypothetical protein